MTADDLAVARMRVWEDALRERQVEALERIAEALDRAHPVPSSEPPAPLMVDTPQYD